MSHTPGPWAISEVRTIDGNPMVVGGEGREFGLVAECCVDEDARLIAAAPDLLEALKETLEIARRNEAGEFVHRAKAAIAKAEGRS